VDRCVSEFIRVTGTLLPCRAFERVVPELRNGSRTAAGVPVRRTAKRVVVARLCGRPTLGAPAAPMLGCGQAGITDAALAHLAHLAAIYGRRPSRRRPRQPRGGGGEGARDCELY